MNSTETGSFTIEERKAYFTRKWRREHKFFRLLTVAAPVFLCITGALTAKPLAAALSPILWFVLSGYAHNSMAIYVENAVYKD